MPGRPSAARQRWSRLGATTALLLLWPIHMAAAQDAALVEYAVKAAYLYKFAPFVEWPPGAFDGASGAVNLCVVGFDPFGPILDETVEGQAIGGRPIALRRLPTVDADAGCHILYAGGSPAQPIPGILDAVAGTPVLTFTDATLTPDDKGIVHFVVQENRVRFEIDDQAAAENGLLISAKVLSLALSVKPRS